MKKKKKKWKKSEREREREREWQGTAGAIGCFLQVVEDFSLFERRRKYDSRWDAKKCFQPNISWKIKTTHSRVGLESAVLTLAATSETSENLCGRSSWKRPVITFSYLTRSQWGPIIGTIMFSGSFSFFSAKAVVSWTIKIISEKIIINAALRPLPAFCVARKSLPLLVHPFSGLYLAPIGLENLTRIRLNIPYHALVKHNPNTSSFQPHWLGNLAKNARCGSLDGSVPPLAFQCAKSPRFPLETPQSTLRNILDNIPYHALV